MRLWPFTILGLLTYGLWVSVEAGFRPAFLVEVLRVAALPMYAMRMIIVMLLGDILALGDVGRWIDWLTVPFLLLPYVVIDIAWQGLRRTTGTAL